MRYLLLLYVQDRPEPGTPEAAEAFAAIARFHAECEERGALVASDPLLPPSAARTVRVRAGRPLVSDGPFAETREWLGGFFVLEGTEEEVMELAARCPTAATGAVEVRPVLGR